MLSASSVLYLVLRGDKECGGWEVEFLIGNGWIILYVMIIRKLTNVVSEMPKKTMEIYVLGTTDVFRRHVSVA